MKSRSAKRGAKRSAHLRIPVEREPLSHLIRKKLESNSRPIRFGIRFILLLSIFFAACVLMRFKAFHVEIGINAFTAKTVAYVLRALNLETQRTYHIISACGHKYQIIFECTGLYTAFLYLSCVLAFPASIKRKIAGLALGLPVIFIVNIIRLTTLIILDIWRPKYSDIVHLYVWDASFIILVVILFQIWIDGIVKGTMHKLIFLSKFFAYSITLFILFIYTVRNPYQNLLAHIIRFLFEQQPHLDQNNVPLVASRVYNYVTFASLMLATSRMPWVKKLKSIGLGLILIFSYHCIASVCLNVPSYQNVTGSYRVSSQIINLIIYFALPLLLWILFTYKYTFKGLRSTRTL